MVLDVSGGLFGQRDVRETPVSGVTSAANLTDGKIVQGDGGSRGIKTSTATVAQVAANVAHGVSDGSAHSKVGANETAIALNTTHAASDGSGHADVATNSAARHAASHTVVSHSDTTATGAEMNVLVGGGVTALHSHAAAGDFVEVLASGKGSVALTNAGTVEIVNINVGAGVLNVADMIFVEAFFETDAVSSTSAGKRIAIDIDDGTNVTTLDSYSSISPTHIMNFHRCVVVQGHEATTKLLGHVVSSGNISGPVMAASVPLGFTEATQIANWMSAGFDLQINVYDSQASKTCYYNYKVYFIKHI